MLGRSLVRQSIEHKREASEDRRQTQMASLLSALYDRAQTTFTLADAVEITRLRPALASSLLHKAAHAAGLALEAWCFCVGSARMGSATDYSGNRIWSHGASLATRPISSRTLPRWNPPHGHPAAVRDLHIGAQNAFRTAPWKGRNSGSFSSSRTIPSARQTLGDQTGICGNQRSRKDGDRRTPAAGILRAGVTEVAESSMDAAGRICNQASSSITPCVWAVGAVARRLGYLLELYWHRARSGVGKIRRVLTLTYLPLDPVLPREGPHVARWRCSSTSLRRTRRSPHD